MIDLLPFASYITDIIDRAKMKRVTQYSLFSLPLFIFAAIGFLFVFHGGWAVSDVDTDSVRTSSNTLTPECRQRQVKAAAERVPVEAQRASLNNDMNDVAQKGAARSATGAYASPPNLTARERTQLNSLMDEYIKLGNSIDTINAKYKCEET